MPEHCRVWFVAVALVVATNTVGSTALGDAAVPKADELSALDSSSGTQRWIATPGGVALVVVGEDRGVVVVASTSSCRSTTSTLRGLDSRTGHQRWQTEIASSQLDLRETAVGAGVTIARASADTFEGIDVHTGKVRWHSEPLTPSPSGPPPPVFTGSQFVIAGMTGEPPTAAGPPARGGPPSPPSTDEAVVRAIDPRTGTTSWTTQPVNGDVDGLAADSGSVYLAVPSPGSGPGLPALEIRGLDGRSGATTWQRSLGQVENFSPLVVADGTVVATGIFATATGTVPTASASSSSTQITALDTATGEVRWQLDSDDHTQPTSAGSAVVAIHEGRPVAVDSRTGKQLWEATAPAKIKEASLSGNTRIVVVSNFDGPGNGVAHAGVAALDTRTGRLRWQSTGPAGVLTADHVYTILPNSTGAQCPSRE
jgi:outer membrane protein assembly factor BamB